MLKLEDLKSGLSLDGLEPATVVTIAAAAPLGDGAVQVFYRTPQGTTKERLLSRVDEHDLRLATNDRPWSFDGDAAAFQLTCEARRIDLAFLFAPMMAVHTSNVDPLPHQITVVCEAMLPKQLLRFVLADELTGSRKGSVGFALTALQRRLASSPEAIYQSLKRRREHLEGRLREEKPGARGRRALAEVLQQVPDDDLTAEEQENPEENPVDDAIVTIHGGNDIQPERHVEENVR
jgi:hypothetical protein